MQLPNNLFYNTGITTYIWILSNNKTANRKGKVQLIDAGQLFRKLRKNLGNKNCEFAPKHITEIVKTYTDLEEIERTQSEGIAAKVFDNSDFGYHKVTIERPKRLKAQFTAERIAELRFDKTLREAMEYCYKTYGEAVYTDIKIHEKAITDWCEKQELNLNAKQLKALTTGTLWKKQLDLMTLGQTLMKAIGTNEYSDFNNFKDLVATSVKTNKLKVSASELNAIYNVIS